jgi:ubiquinone biosynthesis protein
LREQLAQWIVSQLIPAEALVPDTYERWRKPVRDAMLFVIRRISAARLAPKLVEQFELSPDTPHEERLLCLIAKVPGLQKLGQVIARNRNLGPALRHALSKLENDIRDVSADEICAIVHQELGTRMDTFGVRIQPFILSEASVSAVVRFTFRDPTSGQQGHGVFKVLKPHIPAYFAEDMNILQGLAEYFGPAHPGYGFAAHVLTDTFTKVRRLLEHEVDFLREQATLRESCAIYRTVRGVRVPVPIEPLSTPKVTAMTEEHGGKVTEVVARLPRWRRERIAEQLIESLIAVPLLTPESDALFHADPHAGNLLYDVRSGELTILDWALTERLSHEQRRHLALLVIMVGLRDPVRVSAEILALAQQRARRSQRQITRIRRLVAQFLDEMPLTKLPGAVEAMRLVERVALGGIRFPGTLIMFSKAVFTLEGILDDIAVSHASMGTVLGRVFVYRWLTRSTSLPFTARDWVRVHASALLLGARLAVLLEQSLLKRLPQPRRLSPGLISPEAPVAT